MKCLAAIAAGMLFFSFPAYAVTIPGSAVDPEVLVVISQMADQMIALCNHYRTSDDPDVQMDDMGEMEILGQIALMLIDQMPEDDPAVAVLNQIEEARLNIDSVSAAGEPES